MLSSAQSLVWSFLAGGSGAALVMLLFQRFGTGWIDNRFARSLEAFKHQQITDLEHWKVTAAREQHVATALTERIFELLPKVWERVSDAYAATQSMAAFLKEITDLEPMSDEEVDLVLAAQELPELHRMEIKAAAPKDRTRIFGRAVQYKSIRGAHNTNVEAQHALSNAAIFLDADAVARIQKFLDQMWEAMVDFRVSQDAGTPPPRDGGLAKFRTNGGLERTALENYLRARFYPDIGPAASK